MTDGTNLFPLRASGRPRPGGLGIGRSSRRGGHPFRARDVAISAPARARRSQFLRWALTNGRSVDGDAASVVVAVFHLHGGRRIRLTDDLLTELFWIDAVQWCHDHGVPHPKGFSETVHAMVDFAITSGWAHRDSDPTVDLHRTIDALGAPSLERHDHSFVPIA